MSDSTVLENSLKLQLHKAPNHSGLSQRWLSYMTPDIQELEQIKDHFMYLGKSWNSSGLQVMCENWRSSSLDPQN